MIYSFENCIKFYNWYLIRFGICVNSQFQRFLGGCFHSAVVIVPLALPINFSSSFWLISTRISTVLRSKSSIVNGWLLGIVNVVAGDCLLLWLLPIGECLNFLPASGDFSRLPKFPLFLALKGILLLPSPWTAKRSSVCDERELKMLYKYLEMLLLRLFRWISSWRRRTGDGCC